MNSMKRIFGVVIRSIILLTLVLSTCVQTFPPPAKAGYDATYGWNYLHDISASINAPGYFDLELDSHGYPHIAYYDDIDHNLVYRYFDGAQWQTGYEQWGYYNYISLELDVNDLPHIAYYSTTSFMPAYSYYDGADWISIPILPSQTSGGEFITLALTDSSQPVVAFNYTSESNLSIATLVNGAFAISEVDDLLPSGDTYSYISLQLDGNDRPHLAYCQGSTLGSCVQLRYANHNGHIWSAESRDITAGAGYYASLALDSAGYPHISYHVLGASLKYIYQDYKGWKAPQTVASGNTGLYSALALDSTDAPVIAYNEQLNLTHNGLRYRYWNGDNWATNMSPDLADAGTYMNLELDSAGNPHLAYWDSNTADLALATYQAMPDLAVTQMWVDTADNRLLATVRNTGQSTYAGDVEVKLYVDGSYINVWGDTPTLLPGAQVVAELPVPVCSATSMEVRVDLVPYGPENNSANNTLSETWLCDTQPVTISNFAISNITAGGFTADWTTNKPAKTRLTYNYSNGRLTGNFTNDTLVTSHHVSITGLESHTVYTVQAISEDAGGLIGTSREKTVKTAALPGDPPDPPEVKIERLSTQRETYQFTATYPDTSNIQRVEFRMDGNLLGTDYTSHDGQFDFNLEPATCGFTRNVFFTQHNVEAQSFTFNGNSLLNQVAFAPVRENFPIEASLIAPAENSTILITGTTVPAGTYQPVKVFAQQFEWQCEYAGGGDVPVDCGDVAQPVDYVRFYINDTLKGTAVTPISGVYSYNWNLGTLPTGDYRIKAVVYATDAGTQELNNTIHIVQGLSDLSFQRAVTRVGNVFRADVTLTNSTAANLPVSVTKFTDSFKGFQAVKQSFTAWNVTASSILQGKQTTAAVTFTPAQTLAPGASYSFYYYVVPILFPDMTTAVYRMGIPNTKISYSQAGADKTKTVVSESIMVNDPAAPGGTSNLAAANGRAIASADYLIITAPGALTDLYVMSDVHTLMGDMARLAALKQGVLAYWDPNLDKNTLNNLLTDNSAWTNRLHPNFEHRGEGYVLLVGETEVIPSYTTGPFTLYWSDEDGSDDYYVDYSDNPYAHTDGNGAPDLVLGRIIGNTAAVLDKAILTSIDTYVNNTYERAQAYVASGVGNQEDTFQNNADTVTATLQADGYTVSKHHWENEAFLDSFSGISFAEHDGLTHADTNGDGTDELIWARDATNQVYFINGTTGMVLNSFPLDFENGDSLTAGDVDGDNVPEIIIGDRNDTIRTYEINGTQTATFNRDFSAWEKVEAGNVDTAHIGDEIVMADDNDLIIVYTSTGTQLRSVDIGALGYDFADYDILRVGNIIPDAPEEIIFTDRTHDKVVVMSGAGAVLHVLNVDFDYGDNMEIANVTGDAMKEIIIADRDNHIRAYSIAGGDNAVLTTYIDIEQYDGLVTRDRAGTEIDDIFHFDRSDRLRRVDIFYPANAIHQFKTNIAGVDLIWFNAHGSPSGMDPAISTSDFPVDFSGSHPIVNAWSCSTGDYENDTDNGIAEEFFKSGAGVYIGATEVSPSNSNSNVSRKLYRDYWEPEGNHKVAKSFLWLKNDRWDVSQYYDWWWYFINEYNFYGDPKFDITSPTITGLSPEPDRLAVQSLDASQTLTIDLPMYTVETLGTVDYVEIPQDDALGTHSGDLFLDQGEYQVPMYTHTILIPAGQQVQNVTLTARDDKTAHFGLNLPLTSMDKASAVSAPIRSALTQQTLSSIPGHDWSPNFEAPFSWSVYDDIGGGSTLILTINPFYYDPAALYSEYYQHFEFTIETTPTSVQILGADTDQPAYRRGDTVQLDLQVENSAPAPLSLVVSTFIRKAGSGEVVDGFELAALDNLVNTGGVQLDWDWTDPAILPGSYTIEIVVEDMAKNRLAQRTIDMDLGVTTGEVTEFSVSPAIFKPGNVIGTTLEFTNTGDLPLSGQAVIQVQTLTDDIVTEFVQPFSALAAGSTATAQLDWNSTAASETDYRLVGYVNYSSQTTPAVIKLISTHTDVYIPLVKR